VAALTGIPADCHEPPQIARYQAGQFYLAHFDAFDVTTASGNECVATGGQRIGTVLVYLNSVPQGGATYFPRLELRSQPVQGTALIFFPCSLEADLDPLTLHAAETAQDEKWVCQIWIRQKPYV
jgi:prolyl 4-hydroxylase